MMMTFHKIYFKFCSLSSLCHEMCIPHTVAYNRREMMCTWNVYVRAYASIHTNVCVYFIIADVIWTSFFFFVNKFGSSRQRLVFLMKNYYEGAKKKIIIKTQTHRADIPIYHTYISIRNAYIQWLPSIFGAVSFQTMELFLNQ